MFALEGCPHCVALRPIFERVAASRTEVPRVAAYVVYTDVVDAALDVLSNGNQAAPTAAVLRHVQTQGYPLVARLCVGRVTVGMGSGPEAETAAVQRLNKLFT